MDFASVPVGTRRSSTIVGFPPLPSRSSMPSLSVARDVSERRRSSILSLAGADVRRRSSAISLNFEHRQSLNKTAQDEPILLCKEGDSYLFFSMSSDGLLNYKIASKVSGSMTKYLVDATNFNPEHAPVVVLSSPDSGLGLADQTYSRILLPILKHFRVAHSHIALKDENTAAYLATNGQFTAGTIFVLLSGDGVIHEVINGLAQNVLFEAHGTPIRMCPVPCGTGNGLAASLKISNVAQGIRAIFKNQFQILPVLQICSPSIGENVYAAVVFSYGLHAAVVRDHATIKASCGKENSSVKFQEIAKKHLQPAPHLYQAGIKLQKANRFPDFAGPESDQEVGRGHHSYCLITRCSNLESDWKIAPMANPLAENGKFDLVRIGDITGAELGSILLDGYKSGAQINRARFEYYRARKAEITINDNTAQSRIVCIDGATHQVEENERVEISVQDSIGRMGTVLYIQRL